MPGRSRSSSTRTALHAEGTMTRPTIGAERVELRLGGHDWTAEAGPRGVTWKKRIAGAWKEAAPPDSGPRLYQRVTVAFDPRKQEGAAPLVSTEDGIDIYRFTDANTGELHEVRIRPDGSIASMKIGSSVHMSIRP